MGKIQVTTNRKTGQVKYYTYLPKEIMDSTFAAQPGDLLILKSVVGSEITFTFKRKTE